MASPATPAAKPAPATPAAAPAAVPSRTISVAVIAIVLGIVVAVECVLAYLFLPRGAATSGEEHAVVEVEEHGAHHATPDAHAAASGHGAHASHGAHGTPGNAAVRDAEILEVDLGEFRVSSYNPLSNMTLRIDFHMYGTIMGKDHTPFEGLMAVHRNRIRDQVIVTVRSSEMADLADPGLGLIKRKILWTTNQTLGKPMLKSVVFSDFSCVEQ